MIMSDLDIVTCLMITVGVDVVVCYQIVSHKRDHERFRHRDLFNDNSGS